MSNDLISRKVVLDYLREQQTNLIIEENKNNPVTHEQVKGCIASVTAFQNFIAQCPIAYDIDKVISDIEELYVDIVTDGDATALHHWNGALEKSLDIVKEGGV